MTVLYQATMGFLNFKRINISMNNLQLIYRYRDVDNYKQFGPVIFSNPARLTLEEARSLLLPKLISEEYFVPDDWGLARLHASPNNPAVDHEWHEFEDFEETGEEVMKCNF